MDAGTAKKLIEKNLSYDEVKRLTVKLVQHASPQTPLLEGEPQVLGVDPATWWGRNWKRRD